VADEKSPDKNATPAANTTVSSSLSERISHLEQKHRIFNRSKPINHLKEVLQERGDSIGIARLAGKGEGRRLNMFSETGVSLLSEAYARDLEWLRSQTDHRISFLEALK